MRKNVYCITILASLGEVRGRWDYSERGLYAMRQNCKRVANLAARPRCGRRTVLQISVTRSCTSCVVRSTSSSIRHAAPSGIDCNVSCGTSAKSAVVYKIQTRELYQYMGGWTNDNSTCFSARRRFVKMNLTEIWWGVARFCWIMYARQWYI